MLALGTLHIVEREELSLIHRPVVVGGMGDERVVLGIEIELAHGTAHLGYTALGNRLESLLHVARHPSALTVGVVVEQGADGIVEVVEIMHLVIVFV